MERGHYQNQMFVPFAVEVFMILLQQRWDG